MKLITLLCGLLLWGASVVHADLYQWTDARGVFHVVDDLSAVPEEYRGQMKTHSTPKPTPAQKNLLAPSKAYPPKSQGAFAQQLARDLGMIQTAAEDAIGPLGAAGVQPASSWRVSDPLTQETQDEVVAAARRAAASQRLKLSADGAEAVVRQTAKAFLPPPPVVPVSQPPAYEEQEPEIVIEQQPPQVVEIIREPFYVPEPVIVGVPYWHGDAPPRDSRGVVQRDAPKRGPQFSAPAPTHMPFGASHMPFGSSHRPFGSK
ncbi:MAG: DUF4124 domain-containing protein [Deltaproteobacteria bacterium]|nr:DUF4124 domain-containing protein [Deltaproteobacteria bacterium]